jgi:hypothetical protein
VGMFDWYQPSASFNCPTCCRPLSDWQGKDGPNALLVWREGAAAPVDQRVDDDARGRASIIAALRLPSEFVIHTSCCGRFLVEAICATEAETWVRTRLAGPADVDRIHYAEPREVRDARKRELSRRSAG